ncbi:MAG: hypothetical protein J5881_01545 [Clostridia bacterium]|nr:hypothetical protein [Clostridia bacterium]
MNISSEKGITLTSLIIYVIAMLITITIITVVTGYFKKNIEIDTENYTFYGEFTKFQSFFTDEVNRKNNRILEISNGETENSQSYIAFASGNQYTFVPANNAIYQNNVKIANGVHSCKFEEINDNGKPGVRVTIKIKGNKESNAQIRTLNYILEN